MKKIILLISLLSYCQTNAQVIFNIQYSEGCKWDKYTEEFIKDCIIYKDNSVIKLDEINNQLIHTTKKYEKKYLIKSFDRTDNENFHVYNVVDKAGKAFYIFIDLEENKIGVLPNNNKEMKNLNLVKYIFK